MKSLAIFFMLTLSASAFAKIPEECKQHLEEAVKIRKDWESKVPQLIASGELTNEVAELYRDAFSQNIDALGHYCYNLRATELQESSPRISPDKLKREAEKTFNEVVEYYKKKIKN